MTCWFDRPETGRQGVELDLIVQGDTEYAPYSNRGERPHRGLELVDVGALPSRAIFFESFDSIDKRETT